MTLNKEALLHNADAIVNEERDRLEMAENLSKIYNSFHAAGWSYNACFELSKEFSKIIFTEILRNELNKGGKK